MSYFFKFYNSLKQKYKYASTESMNSKNRSTLAVLLPFHNILNIYNKYLWHQENQSVTPKAAGKGVILFGIPSSLSGDLSIT